MKDCNNIHNLGEIDIVYKYASSIENRPKIESSRDAVEVFKQLYITEKLGIQEQFIVLFLNRASKVIGSCNLFMGGTTSTVVDTKIVVAMALKLLATSIVISHNHPSGNLKASNEDMVATSKMKEALELFDMKLLDHIIVAPDLNYMSFSDDGIL